MVPLEIRKTLARSKLTWRLALIMPVVYALICYLADRFYFQPYHRTGLFNVTSTLSWWAMTGLGLFLVLVGEPLLLIVKGSLLRRLREIPPTKDDVELAAYHLARSGFRLLLISDLAALAGMIVFLATGNWRAFIIGFMISYVYYWQTRPSDRWLPQRLRDR